MTIFTPYNSALFSNNEGCILYSMIHQESTTPVHYDDTHNNNNILGFCYANLS